MMIFQTSLYIGPLLAILWPSMFFRSADAVEVHRTVTGYLTYYDPGPILTNSPAVTTALPTGIYVKWTDSEGSSIFRESRFITSVVKRSQFVLKWNATYPNGGYYTKVVTVQPAAVIPTTPARAQNPLAEYAVTKKFEREKKYLLGEIDKVFNVVSDLKDVAQRLGNDDHKHAVTAAGTEPTKEFEQGRLTTRSTSNIWEWVIDFILPVFWICIYVMRPRAQIHRVENLAEEEERMDWSRGVGSARPQTPCTCGIHTPLWSEEDEVEGLKMEGEMNQLAD